jgi:hypothetical protein
MAAAKNPHPAHNPHPPKVFAVYYNPKTGIEIQEAEVDCVIKTEKEGELYCLKGNTGYGFSCRKTLLVGRDPIFFTPQAAVRSFIEDREVVVNTLKVKMTDQARMIEIAGKKLAELGPEAEQMMDDVGGVDGEVDGTPEVETREAV